MYPRLQSHCESWQGHEVSSQVIGAHGVHWWTEPEAPNGEHAHGLPLAMDNSLRRGKSYFILWLACKARLMQYNIFLMLRH